MRAMNDRVQAYIDAGPNAEVKMRRRQCAKLAIKHGNESYRDIASRCGEHNNTVWRWFCAFGWGGSGKT